MRSFILVLCSIAAAAGGDGQQVQTDVVSAGVPGPTPLREFSTTQAFHDPVAWVEPIQCDQDANAYLLLAPHASVRDVQAAARAERSLPLIPRQVLRISADGKKKTTFDPGASPKLAKADTLKTLKMTIGQDGNLYMLVWAAWSGDGKQGERSGLHILSFNREGKHGSEVEVDYNEILVREFEVFGSGDFLLIGHPGGDLGTERVAILPASGGPLRDVPGWSDYPVSGPNEETSHSEEAPHSIVLRNRMTRGGDGRIYIAEQGPRPDAVVVYAIEPSGASGEVFRLRPTQGGQQLQGLKAAGDKVAALYSEPSPDGTGGRWWIAVYDSLLGGEMQSLFGPLARMPFCYQRDSTGDKFTLLVDGRLLTVAP